jgi:DNA end-binding protein Ku
MALRSFWKGYLKLSLVTCAVAMIPAKSDAEKVRFHTLNRKTGNRVESQSVDAETGKPVPEDDQVKGYQKGENDYVLLEDDEVDAVALESTRTIDIATFAPKASIGWIWYDQPHFLVPDDNVGVEAFSVIRDAMKATDMVGISRLVLYRRERAVMLEPRDAGIVLWTLRYGDEVRDSRDYFGDIKLERPDAKTMSLMTKLIDDRSKPWDPSMAGDPLQDRLKDIIAAKKKKKGRGERPPAKSERETPTSGNVISIMDALRKSIAADGKRGR